MSSSVPFDTGMTTKAGETGPIFQSGTEVVTSGSFQNQEREVPFSVNGSIPKVNFQFLESAPEKGDYLSMTIPLATKEEQGYLINLALKSPYERMKNQGRIKYQILLNEDVLVEEDIAHWKETNNITIKWMAYSEESRLTIRLLAEEDCEEWEWGKAAKLYIGSFLIREFNHARRKIEIVSTSPYSKVYEVTQVKSSMKTLAAEQTFTLTKPVRYIFQESTTNNPYLMVIFSAFNGKEEKRHPALYNYRKTLKDMDCNKLFILDDYDGEICYYIGRNKDHSYEASVVGLISKIMNQLNIPADNVITSGSSKGGTAALYYGYKYEYGSIISGAPQVFIYSYLAGINSKYIQSLATAIAGGNSKEDKKYLDNLLFDAIDNCRKRPDLYLHISKGDSHYTEHALPLIEKLKEKKYKFELDLESYEGHSAVAQHYGEYMVKTTQKIITG